MSQIPSSQKAIIIGAGFSGLSAACYLAKAGYQTTLLEKNSWVGGRAQVWEKSGYRFDMGPSFYWMPEVFDNFFADFQKHTSQYYQITRLDPSYRIFSPDLPPIDIPANMQELENLFEEIEPGSAVQLRQFLQAAQTKYHIAIKDFVYSQQSSITDFINPKLLSKLPDLDLHLSYSTLVRKRFQHPLLRSILEFPTVFLGAYGKIIPGTYTLMNHADISLGTWYPQGGFSKVAQSMADLALELGVDIRLNQEVTGFDFANTRIHQVQTQTHTYSADIVLAASGYQWIDQHLLPKNKRMYSQSYWQKRVLSPSCLNLYLGIDCKLPALKHHTFFFDRDWDTHFEQTYGQNPSWPTDPLFYAHVASQTQPDLAPPGKETLFVLVPMAAGLADDPEQRARTKQQVIQRLSQATQIDLQKHIQVQREYCLQDFSQDYHSYKGSAFGLGHTLLQTAIFRPKNFSTKIPNLYFTGQDTIPGTSTVMSIISGKVSSNLIISRHV